MLAMDGKESLHCQKLEKIEIIGGIRNDSRGQFLAFTIVIIVIIGSIFLIYTGKDFAGLAGIITSVGGLVGAFIYGTRSKRKEREKKFDKH